MKSKTYLMIVLYLLLASCRNIAPAALESTPLPVPSATPSPAEFNLQLQRAAMLSKYAKDINNQMTATRYHITLSIDPSTSQVEGHQDVQYTNAEPVHLQELYFRLFPATPGYGGAMTVTQVMLDNQPRPVELEQDGSALRLAFTQPLQPGQTVTASLDYVVNVPRTITAGYAQLSNVDGVLTLPEVYPLIPAYDQTGWHIELAPNYGDAVYSDIALYEVEIKNPSGMPITTGSCHPAQSNEQDWICASGPARDFMIVLGEQYQMVTQDVGGVNVRSFYFPQHANSGKQALELAARVVQIFSQRFGPYPLAELDVVETATTAGGIEYPGLVVIASSLYDSPEEFFEWVIAHEIAHQWWYSLIGNDQVNHPWLDEALAQYSTILYYEDAHDKATGAYLVNSVFEQTYEEIVQAQADAPVDQPVSFYTPDAYGAIVYRKGPLFFHALRQEMGEQKFDAFLQTYYRQNLYGIATPESLLTAAQIALDKPALQRLYNEWVKGTHQP